MAKQKKFVSLDGLPDPVTDPEGFRRSLQNRINRANEAEVIDELWEKFNATYEDLAPFEEEVAAATRRVVAALEKKGLDPEKVVNEQSDMLLETIASAARSRINAIASGKVQRDAKAKAQSELVQDMSDQWVRKMGTPRQIGADVDDDSPVANFDEPSKDIYRDTLRREAGEDVGSDSKDTDTPPRKGDWHKQVFLAAQRAMRGD